MDKNNDSQQPIHSVNLYFGKKDADLCRWVLSVPRGLFSYLVREAIKSHLRGDNDYKLPTFETKSFKITSITKPLSISCNTPEDKQIYDFVTSFDDNMRSYEIKQILRKYLNPSTNGSADNLITPSKPVKSEPNLKVTEPTKVPTEMSSGTTEVPSEMSSKILSEISSDKERKNIVNKYVKKSRDRSRVN